MLRRALTTSVITALNSSSKTPLLIINHKVDIRNFFPATAMAKKRSSSGEGEPPAKKPTTNNKNKTDFSTIDFSSKDGDFKITTWNVAGLRAWLKNGGLDYFEHEDPDVICLQETKCSDAKLPAEVTGKSVKAYPHKYWFPASSKEGYSGVALWSKKEPLVVTFGFKGLDDKEVKDHDAEGRLITAEFESFFVCGVYVPNAGKKLITLPKRMEWDNLFRKFLKSLKKPVVVCGDLNVAHLEIDLANPKTNKKNAGFTQEERDGFGTMVDDCQVVDTFRHLYPDLEKKYTFWTYMMNARAKNVGWRLDYFLVSNSMMDKVVDNIIRDQVYGSDHCPCTLVLKLK